MWKLNKLDKWFVDIYKKYPLTARVCILVFGILLFAIILQSIPQLTEYNTQSTNYTKGYNDGFSEMNMTKYSVAEIVSNHHEHDMVHVNSDYLNGYIKGYNDAVLAKADAIMGTNCSK